MYGFITDVGLRSGEIMTAFCGKSSLGLRVFQGLGARHVSVCVCVCVTLVSVLVPHSSHILCVSVRYLCVCVTLVLGLVPTSSLSVTPQGPCLYLGPQGQP